MQSEQMLVVLQQARTVKVGTVDKKMLEEQLPLRANMELIANETMLSLMTSHDNYIICSLEALT